MQDVGNIAKAFHFFKKKKKKKNNKKKKNRSILGIFNPLFGFNRKS
jgi:hypothetical protein